MIDLEFGGIPVVVTPYVPKDELWLIQTGERKTIHVQEGPQAGEDIEVWLRRPNIKAKFFNLGSDPFELRIAKRDFKIDLDKFPGRLEGWL